ncbi:BTAD domain-containing putative transcriptional regulator [Streptomyces sp. NPDC046324]|uniref:AfsR/SARP family transcriptional regulator n=1 Tax=Streptomyces sp. NPDC046324 TaxID=3154915 RepID=UPI0033C124C1
MPEPTHRLALHLLGPLRIWRGDRELTVGPPKQRAVLALLAGRRGTVVSRAQIVDALWGTDAPASAANAVHTYVAALRRTLEPDRGSRESGAFIVSRTGGYELRVPADAVDSTVFVRRYEEARQLVSSGDAPAAFERFESALGLWHGEALSGIPGPYAALERTRLRELRFAATEGWIAGLIAADRLDAAIVASSEAIAQEPLRERLRHLHMLALSRCGRQAHAIQAYDEARTLLREELGIDPGQELRELYERILAGEVAAGTPRATATAPQASSAPWPSVSPWPSISSRPSRSPRATRPAPLRTYTLRPSPHRPPSLLAPRPESPTALARRNPLSPHGGLPLNQLPATARVFLGREPELRQAGQKLDQDTSCGSTAPILTVDGPAGVGKTAFALELAHEHAGMFPDGQLYIDLRGTGDSGTRTASDALARLLQGLGVEHDRLPHDLEGRATLYRTLMHGRRMLLLLDDAADADQLRPLVPPGPSAVIVTSRRLQRGLVAREGAQRIGLRPLDRQTAADLFVALLGPERLAGQRAMVERLAEYCGRLPLGIRIAAGTMAANPHLCPKELAERYENPWTRLDHLSVEGDGEASVRHALEASYLSLSPETARLFRALGRSGAGRGGPADTIGPADAAAFTDGDPTAARRRLDALADVGLLERSGSDAYRFDELVGIYASERAAAADRATARSTLLLTPIHDDGFPGCCLPDALARH